MDLWTRLWGRYHVPQNVFLVYATKLQCATCTVSVARWSCATKSRDTATKSQVCHRSNGLASARPAVRLPACLSVFFRPLIRTAAHTQRDSPVRDAASVHFRLSIRRTDVLVVGLIPVIHLLYVMLTVNKQLLHCTLLRHDMCDRKTG